MDWKLYSIFINKLVLVDPQWIRNTPSLADSGGMLGAYRTVKLRAAKARQPTAFCFCRSTL